MRDFRTGLPFEEVLGPRLAGLPPIVRHLHSLARPLVTQGRADVTGATSLAARFVCTVAGLPKPGRDVPVSVTFTPLPKGRERWLRRFGSRTYVSVMEPGIGVDEGLLVERFGRVPLFLLCFRLTPEAAGLRWTLARWRLVGVPLPQWTLPRIDCVESAETGPDGAERFRFDIDVAFPLVGHVLHYTGWLAPALAPPQPPSATR